MSAMHRFWKTRRDGVRQRYWMAESEPNPSVYKALARAFSDACSHGKVERYKSIAPIPHAERMFPELARRDAHDAILNLIEHIAVQGARAVPALRWIYEQSAAHIAYDSKRILVKSSAREAIEGIKGADADQFHADILYDRFDEPLWYNKETEMRAACDYFKKHRSDVGLDALHHTLLNASYFVGKKALEAICELKDPRSTAVIAKALENPPSEKLLKEIIKRLGNFDLRELAPVVLDTVQHVESDERRQIVDVIVGLRDHETIEAFIQHGALKHPNYTVREAMCFAIAKSGYQADPMQLAWMAQKDGSKQVRDAAYRAWKRLQ